MRNHDRAVLNLSGWDNYSEVLIESAGTRIALSIYHAGEGRPCIVFVPGTMTHPLFYDDFLTLLAGAGFNVAGVHPLSHGKSPREKKLFTFADMLQNIMDTWFGDRYFMHGYTYQRDYSYIAAMGWVYLLFIILIAAVIFAAWGKANRTRETM